MRAAGSPRTAAAGAPRQARRGRTAAVVAALFAALGVLGGGAGFVVGAVSSAAAEHRLDGAARHPDGMPGAFLRGPDRE